MDVQRQHTQVSAKGDMEPLHVSTLLEVLSRMVHIPPEAFVVRTTRLHRSDDDAARAVEQSDSQWSNVRRTREQLRLTVRTEQGASDPVTLAPGSAVRVPVPRGDTSWVEVSEPGGAAQPLAISELDVPGTRVRRWLRPPAVPEAWGAPAAISLDADADTRSGCVTILAVLRCAPESDRIGGEETRFFRCPVLSTNHCSGGGCRWSVCRS